MQEKITQEKRKKYKVAMVAPVPFYYQVPLFQLLAKSSEFYFKVYFCSNATISGIDVEKMYNTKNKFLDKEYFLTGYNFKFLKNYPLMSSFLSSPLGLINFGIWKEIRDNKYDVVILQAWNNLTWIIAIFACLIYKTDFVFFTDANILEESLRSRKKIFFKKYFLEKFIFKKAKGFLSTSFVNESLYKAYGVPKEKMVSLHYSYGYEDFLKQAQNFSFKRNELRNYFGVLEKDFVLLFVGRLMENKNLFNLLEAFSKVDCKNKKLFIVGDGVERKAIEKRIKDLNLKEVKLFGFQDRYSISKFYCVADGFVLPSIDEPWGMVVNEAMCFSLPVIVSDKVGSGVELIINNYNGLIFSPNNIVELTNLIKKLVSMSAEERKIFGQRSLKIINTWINSLDPEKQIIKILK